MHPLWRAGWSVAGGLANGLVAIGWPGDGKLARTFRLRRGAIARVQHWATTARDPRRPLLWVHAPSVGEGLMARPVLERVRAAHPDWQVAFTYFSPSAERFAAGLVPSLADVVEILPFDTAAAAEAMLDALRPTALCFSKLDVWPVLVAHAAARGVRVGLVSASVPAQSGRLSPIARAVLGQAYGALSAVGAVDEASARRLVQLGVAASAVAITGDTRYDQVLRRIAALPTAGGWRAVFGDGRPTVVAGSTWPSDEAPLLQAWDAVRSAVPDGRLIVAPHEPTAQHLAPLERALAARGWSSARLGDARVAEAEVVVVDRVGVLADLYAVATAAVVGGGFHAAGLHSVVEPAALGVPVCCGPRDAAQRDARLLETAGGLVRVLDAQALAATLLRWLLEPGAHARASEAARRTIADERGAADRSTALVSRLMDPA